MIRLGLIGCGEHSESQHATPLARYGDSCPGEIELSAVCDIKPERAEYFCQRYGFLKPYGNVDDMLAQEKLDACIAVVPVERIPEVGVKLLNAGMPCAVEKPLGASLDDVKVLVEAARKTGTPNMVSVNRRFMPLLNRAITWARDSGPLRYVRCTFTRDRRTEPEFLWGTAVHAVDTLRHIAGEIAEASIRTLARVEHAADWCAIDIEFSNGVSGRIDVLPTNGVLEETYELIGEGFRAAVTCPFGPQRGARCFRENRLVIEEPGEGVPEEVLNGSYQEAEAFIRAIARQDRPWPSIEEVFPSIELCWRLSERAALQRGNLAAMKS